LNEYQLSKQFRYLLRKTVWPDVGGGLIWSQRVHITNGMAQSEYAMLGSPSVLVGVNDNEADAQSPGYRKQTFTFTYWCAVAGDPRGENAMIGANRTGGNLTSSGRGILEYTEELSRLLRQIQETLGVKIISKHTSDVGTGIVPGLGYVAMRQMLVEAKCSDLRYYHPPLRVKAVGASGHATLTWADPPDRFDGVSEPIQVIYKAGSSPPTSISDGTAASVVARGVFTQVINLSAGTWSFTVFAGYTDSGAAAVERYSEGPVTEEGVSATAIVAGGT
jgi:hypothetical protein